MHPETEPLFTGTLGRASFLTRIGLKPERELARGATPTRV